MGHTSLDATEERRYTLSPATKPLLKNLDDRIYIKVLLDGRFPAGFKRLQESTEDMLRRFAIVSRRLNTILKIQMRAPLKKSINVVRSWQTMA